MDLIDISNNSVSDEIKAEFCRAVNLILIHYREGQKKMVEEFIEKYDIKEKIIYIERDSTKTKV